MYHSSTVDQQTLKGKTLFFLSFHLSLCSQHLAQDQKCSRSQETQVLNSVCEAGVTIAHRLLALQEANRVWSPAFQTISQAPLLRYNSWVQRQESSLRPECGSKSGSGRECLYSTNQICISALMKTRVLKSLSGYSSYLCPLLFFLPSLEQYFDTSLSTLWQPKFRIL